MRHEDDEVAVELQEGGETGTKLKQFVSDVTKADINQHNFKEYLRSVKTNVHIISTQIEHCSTNFEKSKRVHEEIIGKIGKDRLESYEKQGLVDKKMYDSINEALYWMGQSFAWQNILSDMLNTMLQKVARALNITAQYELESVVTQRVSELHKQMMSQTHTLVTELISQQNHRIETLNDNMKARADLLMERNMMQLQQMHSLSIDHQREQWEHFFKVLERVSKSVVVDAVREPVVDAVRSSLRSEKSAYLGLQRKIASEEVRPEELLVSAPSKHSVVAGVPRAERTEQGGGGGDKPFLCEECGKRFGDALQLDAHIETVHDSNDYSEEDDF
jgi:hypothetical protein